MGVALAERTTKVRLSAQVQEYIEGMEKAARATREAGSEAERLTQQREAFQRMGVAAMAMGAAAAAGVTLAVSKWADFDQAMSNVQAATMESAGNMERLSDAALDAGARTVFSAEESANAIEELAKAGVSTSDILNGALDGALDLAAAGNLGVAEAAGIAATALKTFGLEGEDMAHVADLLAAGAGKAMGDVTDLSAAMNQSAMVANATGLTIEETTAALAAFASQGLIGSDAGTSFKSMLQSLTPTSAAARDTMQDLGITAYDAQGNFVGLTQFAGSLEAGLKNLSVEQQQAALKTIFGSDAIRAATVLYSEGADGIQDWIDAVDDQGYAAEQAAARLDNLKGDIEALGGALDTALIKTGSGANDALRTMVQWLTEAVEAYADLPAPLQGAALWVGIVTAAIGLLGGGALFATLKIAELKTSLAILGVTAQGAQAALLRVGQFLTGPWGIAILAAAGVATVLVTEKQRLTDQGRELADTLDAETGAITENSTAWAANKLQQEGILSAGKRLGITADDMTQAWLGNAEALDRVNDRLDRFRNDADFRMDNADWDGWSDDLADVMYALDGSNTVLSEARTRHDELTEATEGSADAMGAGADTADQQADSLELLAGVSHETAEEVNRLADEIRNFGSTQFDVESATMRFYDTLDDLNALLAAGSGSLDVTTQAGRDTNQAMLDVAKSTNDYAASVMAVGGSTADAQGILEAGRQKIIETRMALGDSEEAARAYADRLVSTPEAIATRVELDTAAAEARLVALTRKRWVEIGAIWTDSSGAERVDNWARLPNSADGNLFEFANGGGLETGIYRGGAPLTRFAEPETIWEAFISGKPSERDRNRQIWSEAGERLGVVDELKRLFAGSGAKSIRQENTFYVEDKDPRPIIRAVNREFRDAL